MRVLRGAPLYAAVLNQGVSEDLGGNFVSNWLKVEARARLELIEGCARCSKVVCSMSVYSYISQ
jgi:hypothetical protein